jgi:hypothetical protein
VNATDRQVARSGIKALTGTELVAVYNSLVTEAERVQRFSDKETAVRRTLDAIDSHLAIPDTAPPANKETEVPKPKKAAKKPASPKRGRPTKDLVGTLHIVPAKCKGKKWQKNSARYAAFQYIEKNDGVKLATYVERIGENALALLGKIIEVGCVELRGAE